MESTNPFRQPGEAPVFTFGWRAIRRFGVTFASSFVVAAVGAAATAKLAAQNDSVVVTLLPVAFSLSLSIWFVCYILAGIHSFRRAAMVVAGCLVSLSATGLYLDNVDVLNILGPFSNRYFPTMVSAVIGATVFSVSLAFAGIAPVRVVSMVAAWLIFSVSAFTALIVFQCFLSSPGLDLCIFLCATCFQAALVTTVALLLNFRGFHQGEQSSSCHRVIQAPTA